MTDHAELRRLAEEVIRIERSEDEPISSAWELFDSAANPKAILALLDEIDGLSDELSACTEHPGGCGYWREAAKRRAEERDRLRAQNEALRGALQAVVDDPTWRSNDNTLWPKIIKAMNQPGATSSP
ncbi:TPA: ead/Ea22-like family protein [Pseudomonas aeruginosa]|nr:ead/Ea22-like family protein [Pseudomonas aeruginosa]HBO7216342.1 ead/Ea22-like family protein [Pseudomonas aeruginosa]HBO7227838.1 ead/Ea22-like family protein [Pseudomonas aeruginosa]HBO7234449.1 ead/Ea22-like family protein [Pseudomonas aeruginosa]HBO7259484.1 ead/Ea22-like family protein [Pseudomonas aeruginosa]